ncbi:MAG: type IV secretion protein IcmB, partial [Deltaproteobacteria bacterium]|nr:type IV secretion protein IcmB [Deltaproteobacteria bacterium]
DDHPDLPAAARALRLQAGRLARLVSGWGQADVQESVGDPLMGVCAALPGLMPHGGPAPRAAAPLEAAWSFLPLRPASPWRAGPLVLRTPEGKPMPFAPNSSRQPAWIDVGLAPMGGGKSVLLNAFNLAFCLQPGLTRLPWVSVIDVGPSSSGLVELLKAALPPELAHQAVHHRLRLTPTEAFNPFDTPLGCREPLPAQLSFLVNFLCLLATPLDRAAPPPGVDGVARLAVLAAYRELADRPRLASANAAPELWDRALSEGLQPDEATSWWELTDFFFDRGLTHQALEAQRLAMPTLTDVAGQVRQHPGLRAAYNFQADGQPVLDHVWRALAEAVAAYRFLALPTKLSLGDARVVSLDLDEVAVRGGGAAGDRQTAVMYMLARHLVGARFFLTPADAALMPEPYRGHHLKLIEEIRQDPKRLCYDELHRVAGQSAVARQLLTDLETSARESRKWNLSIGLYSQSWADVPPVILELATAVFLLGAGTDKGRAEIAEVFGLNRSLQAALERLGRPGPEGAGLVALFKTADGPARQLLVNTVSPALLWAFSTTTEDMTVRNALYQAYGVERTLSALAERWPTGLKVEAERRRQARERGGPFEKKLDALSELTAETARWIDDRPATGWRRQEEGTG